ncbi:DNA-binding response regulator [Erysipelotrichaceae bacterium AF15-26LB]|nr:helix-turn-helix transcriptional regulator [[Clostridium] innocuum]RJV83720.1 DNA-binding response regulator [Erysipelotrichaceae bacterium AF15-26LB]RJV86370.1 DNA-binding response regulator [Erysipelotrichaceae bacterium AF19-24AC]
MRQIARKQFNSLLINIKQYPLVCIYGPDGFGKRTAVHAFLHNRKETYTWIDMYKKDRKLLKELLMKECDKNDIIILNQYRNHVVDSQIIEICTQGEHSCRIIILATDIPSFFNAKLQKWILMIPIELYPEYPYAWLRVIMDSFNNLQDMFHGTQLLEKFLSALEQGKLHGDESLLRGEVELILAYSRYNNLHEMSRYFKRSKTLLRDQTSRINNAEIITTLGSPHNLFLYHQKPGDIQRLVNILRKDLHYYQEITNHSNGGLKEQAVAEQLLESGRFTESIHAAWEAYYIAEHYRQKWICVSSLFTIGRSAYHLRDQVMLQYVLQRLTDVKKKETLPPLLAEIDLAQAYLYILTDRCEAVAEWIREGREGDILQGAVLYSSIVYGMYLIKTRNYAKLHVVASLLESHAHERKQLFATIYALLFQCILLKEKDDQPALRRTINRLIYISQPDGIMTTILELGKDVFLACSEHWKWRKLYRLLEAHRDYNSYGLTERELELVDYVLKGYSRKEMAEASGLKVNTIGSYMKKLYRKLNIHNRTELKERFIK